MALLTGPGMGVELQQGADSLKFLEELSLERKDGGP